MNVQWIEVWTRTASPEMFSSDIEVDGEKWQRVVVGKVTRLESPLGNIPEGVTSQKEAKIRNAEARGI